MIKFKKIDWETFEFNGQRMSKEKFKEELLNALEELTGKQYERHCEGKY